MYGIARGTRGCTLALAVAVSLLFPAVSMGDTLPLMKAGPAEQSFRRGVAALRNNDLQGAEAAFNASLKAEPKAASSLLGLAQVAAKRGDRKASITYLQRAFAIAPESAEVQRNWARSRVWEGKPDDAKAALSAAAAIDPTSAGPRVDMGDLYMIAFNKPSEAVPFYKQAIAIDPKHAGAHYALGVALAETGDEAGAIKSLTEAAALAPTNPLPLYQLGIVHKSKGRFDPALDAIGRALKIAPTFGPAILEHAGLLIAKNRDADAIAELTAATTSNPRLAGGHVMLGMAQQRIGRWSDAETAYRAAVKLDPNQAIAYNNLAWMAAEKKIAGADALAWAQKAVTLAPKASPFFTTLGWVYRSRGDLARATDTLAKAAAMKPERAEAFYYLGIAQSEKGDRPGAAASFRKALALNAQFAAAADAQQRLKALGS